MLIAHLPKYSALLSLTMTTLMSFPAHTQEWVLTEKSLIEEFQKASPDRLRSLANLQSSQADLESLNGDYGFKSLSQARFQDSGEKAIASFIPTFGPTYYLSTGVSKKTRNGAEFDVSVFADQQSTADGFIDKATRTGLVFNLSADLWKNLFGRLDKAKILRAEFKNERQKIENEIRNRELELDLRKVYWSLVANNEKLKAAKALLQISEKQLSEGLKRKGQFIADNGEISKYRSQVESRKATINSYEYERDIFLRSLKAALPQSATHKIVLGPYNRESKIREVLMCSNVLQEKKQTPWENTKWDEVIELIEKTYQQKKIETARSSDFDLKLESQLRYSGVDRGFSNSFSDLEEEGKVGGSAGLTLTIPLESSEKKAQQARIAADYSNFTADKMKYRALIESQHSQIVSLVKRLQDAIRNLNANSANLKVSVKESEKKFKQARISVNDLISDQNALFSNAITEIDTQLQVIHTLLDYFKVFTEDDCSVNKVGA